MQILLIAVGRLKAGPERELCDRYVERVRAVMKSCGIQDLKIVELSESSARRPADRQADEGKAIAAAVPAGAKLCVLDERGRSMTSPIFADFIRETRESGARCLVFVVGGPDGLSPELVRKADLSLAFGALTMPHQIVRALLAEQLYRAVTLITGHPYHRV